MRSVALAILCACLLAAPAGAAVVGPKRHGELSPALVRLAKPAVRAKSPVRQAALLGLPESGPGSLVRKGRRVLAKVRFKRGAIAGLSELRAAGARIVSASRRYQTVTVAVAPAGLRELTAVPGVRAVWPSRAPILYGGAQTSVVGEGSCEGGSVISEGLGQLKVDEAREAFGLRGKGITVGVLSDSFDGSEEAGLATDAHQDILSGDLPGPAGTCSGQQVAVNVLAEGFGVEGADEGRGMLQIVHDLAPHASLAFATAFEGEESFAQNIERLARPVAEGGAGAQVIVDDVGYFEEPFFQDGPIAAAVNKVTAEEVTYLSAAGNDNLFEGEKETVKGEEGIASWEAPEYRDSGGCLAAVVALSEGFEEIEEEEELVPVGLHPSHCMDFDPGAGEDNTFGITVAPGKILTIDLQWAEPWNGVGTDLDAFLISRGEVVGGSIERNVGTQRPVEVAQWENPSGQSRTVKLAINRFSGAENPVLKFALLQNGGGVSATEYPESSGGDVVGPTVFGHAGASGAIALGAVHFSNGTRPERYSSRGPVTHYFEAVKGVAPAAELGSPEVIPKPDLVATDCGATTFFAFLEGPTWRFCGTSAAAPHAAAVAALLRQGDPTATPEQVRGALTESAVAMPLFGASAVGAGLLDAPGAVEKLPPTVAIDDGPSTVVPPLEGEKPPPPPPPPPGATRPTTSILRHPPGLVLTRRRAARLVFRFGSDQAGVTFLCKVDAGAFAPCPARFVRRFRLGLHTVRVKARNQAGQADLTPAVFRFRLTRVG